MSLYLWLVSLLLFTLLVSGHKNHEPDLEEDEDDDERTVFNNDHFGNKE